MTKLWLICLLLLVVFSLQALDTFPDIYDTLNVVLNMQGVLGYCLNSGIYLGGGTSPIITTDEVGDCYDSYSDDYISLRIFTSFATQPTPENYRLESATFSVMETWAIGNSELSVFPIWNDNEYYPCMLAHVDYGDSLGRNDFFPVILEDVGALTDSWVLDI